MFGSGTDATPAALNADEEMCSRAFSYGRTRLWLPPAAILLTPLRPLTATGRSESVFVPLPSWPDPLRPQAMIVPSESRARLIAATSSDLLYATQATHPYAQVGVTGSTVASFRRSVVLSLSLEL